MRVFSVLLFLLFIVSCNQLKYSAPERASIDYIKQNTLDPKQFELISISSQAFRLSDKLKKSIGSIESKASDYMVFEELKGDVFKARDVSPYRLSSNYLREQLRQLVDGLDKYDREVEKYGKDSKYAKFLLEARTSDPDILQSLFTIDPDDASVQIAEIEKKIEHYKSGVNENKILHYNVEMRFYAINRLGTRGVSDASLRVTPPGDDGTFVVNLISKIP